MPHVISPRESLYLDLLRATAAFAVLLDHATQLFDLPFLPAVGHKAVIVFFVLSGYVIANVAERRERTAREFLIARLARLWSVLVPAMVLTIVADLVGRAFGSNAGAYAFAPIDYPLIRLGAVLVFLSETWVSITPFSNFPTWSLSIEFWYYMIFAAWVFTRPGRVRAVTVGCALMLCGPKGVILLPVWLTGVALQRTGRVRIRTATGVILFAGGLAACQILVCSPAYFAVRRMAAAYMGPWLAAQLGGANAFPFDWALGIALGLHLSGARIVLQRVAIERFARPIRACAGLSFATYLFHMPLLRLASAFLPADAGWAALGLTMTAIAALGSAAERSKSRWKRGLDAVVDAVIDRVRSRRGEAPG